MLFRAASLGQGEKGGQVGGLTELRLSGAGWRIQREPAGTPQESEGGAVNVGFDLGGPCWAGKVLPQQIEEQAVPGYVVRMAYRKIS